MTQDHIESIKVMHLLPGDTLVVKVEQYLTKQQRDDLRAAFDSRFLNVDPKRVLILEGGMSLDVLRAAGSSDAAETQQAVPQ